MATLGGYVMMKMMRMSMPVMITKMKMSEQLIMKVKMPEQLIMKIKVPGMNMKIKVLGMNMKIKVPGMSMKIKVPGMIRAGCGTLMSKSCF